MGLGVRWEMIRQAAMSRLVNPSPTTSAIHCSRRVNASGRAGGGAVGSAVRRIVERMGDGRVEGASKVRWTPGSKAVVLPNNSPSPHVTTTGTSRTSHLDSPRRVLYRKHNSRSSFAVSTRRC